MQTSRSDDCFGAVPDGSLSVAGVEALVGAGTVLVAGIGAMAATRALVAAAALLAADSLGGAVVRGVLDGGLGDGALTGTRLLAGASPVLVTLVSFLIGERERSQSSTRDRRRTGVRRLRGSMGRWRCSDDSSVRLGGLS